MSETFSIKSTHTDRALVFSGLVGEYFRVELLGGITASVRVYNYEPHAQELVSWFKELGGRRSPWNDVLSWQSLEGEFSISAQCDALGHIQFMIGLADMMGTNEESTIKVGIETELGQLVFISKGACRFFSD